MTQDLKKEIRECRAHAEYCEQQAKAVQNAEARMDFLRLQKSWLDLAHSYEFAEQMLIYTDRFKERRERRP